MRLRLKLLDWFFFLLSLSLLVTGILFYIFANASYLPVFIVLINLTFIVKFYNRIPLLILFVFFLMYTQPFIFFFINDIYISYWKDFQTESAMSIVMISHLLFLFFLGNSVSSFNSNLKLDITQITKANPIIFFAILLACLLILVFGLTGENIFQSGSYSNSELVQKSTLHEYFILLFLFLIIYSPQNFIYRILLFFLYFVFVIKTLLYGGRVEVVQISLLLIYLFLVFKNKIKSKQIIFLMILGIYLNGVVSNVRANPMNLLNENYIDLLNPFEIVNSKKADDILSSTEGDVIQSSARMIGMVQLNEITFRQRIISFYSYLFSSVIPLSILPPVANLSTFKQDLYQSGGGGLISSYFFVWFGYLGPIFIALLIGFFIRKFYEFQSPSFIIYGICLISMFPRWFSYNPIFLVKFCLYAVLFHLIVTLGKNLVRNIFT